MALTFTHASSVSGPVMSWAAIHGARAYELPPSCSELCGVPTTLDGTLRATDWPTDDCTFAAAATDDGQAFTVTIAAWLSAAVQPPAETRTQNDVVAVSAGVVKTGEFVPTGAETSPAAPRYH